jgi:hypothetical protein
VLSSALASYQLLARVLSSREERRASNPRVSLASELAASLQLTFFLLRIDCVWGALSFNQYCSSRWCNSKCGRCRYKNAFTGEMRTTKPVELLVDTKLTPGTESVLRQQYANLMKAKSEEEVSACL